jgi:glycosyltransferase involved in cell wall biosynthesis
MLTPYLPYPPASGGQIRTLNLLKHLSKNHTITLIALYKTEKEKEYASFLKSYCKEIYLCKRPEKPWTVKNVVKTILSTQPFVIVRNYSTEAKRKVEDLLQSNTYDVIHAETFYIMPHIPETNTPVFLLEQTIEYEVYQHFVDSLPFLLRPLFLPEILKHKIKEREYWRRAYLVGTVSESDKKKIEKLEPEIKPVVIPNGAGDDMFVDKLVEKDIKNPTLLFVGSFFWLQNTEAAQYLIQKIYPKLIKVLPDIKIVIAGQNAAKKLPPVQDDHIKIVDVAQDDTHTIESWYKKATLLIAPIFGPGGTRLKILAAMASGLPIITTHTGVSGLD